MFPVDASGPTSVEFVPERFGLAYPRKWIALGFSNQAKHSKSLRSVLAHPPGEIVEASSIKFQASQQRPRKISRPGAVWLTEGESSCSRTSANMLFLAPIQSRAIVLWAL